MRRLLIMLGLCALSATLIASESVLNHSFKQLASEDTLNLNDAYAGKVVLVVNTASKCGNTPQYEGLEALYQQHRDAGLVVIGFPSNDFAGQEPGTEAEIQSFCRLTYGVKFPMFEKTVVRGDDAHPFYRQLAAATGTYPTWNFHKYLIGRDGAVIDSFSPSTLPSDAALVRAIEDALDADT